MWPLFFFDPVAISELPIPPYFNQGLALLAVAGCLFLIAGRGVAEKSHGAALWGQLGRGPWWRPWWRRFTYSMVGIPQKMGLGGERHPFQWFNMIWMAVGVLVAMQFLVPAYFALGYLQRLKQVLVDETILGRPGASSPAVPGVPGDTDKYCHALLPFGIYFNFFVIMGAGDTFLFPGAPISSKASVERAFSCLFSCSSSDRSFLTTCRRPFKNSAK